MGIHREGFQTILKLSFPRWADWKGKGKGQKGKGKGKGKWLQMLLGGAFSGSARHAGEQAAALGSESGPGGAIPSNSFAAPTTDGAAEGQGEWMKGKGKG